MSLWRWVVKIGGVNWTDFIVRIAIHWTEATHIHVRIRSLVTYINNWTELFTVSFNLRFASTLPWVQCWCCSLRSLLVLLGLFIVLWAVFWPMHGSILSKVCRLLEVVALFGLYDGHARSSSLRLTISHWHCKSHLQQLFVNVSCVGSSIPVKQAIRSAWLLLPRLPNFLHSCLLRLTCMGKLILTAHLRWLVARNRLCIWINIFALLSRSLIVRHNSLHSVEGLTSTNHILTT